MNRPAPENPAAVLPDAVLGIDIGGTSVRVGIVDRGGRLHALARADTPAHGDPEQLAATLAHLAAEVAAQAPATPALAGVALPGIRSANGDVVNRAVNLPRLEGVNVRELCERVLKCPVRLETDVNAAGWAQWHALDPRPRRFVYLAIGTGVGGCVILDGQIVRHTHDGPGHLGHLIVHSALDAPHCACGARGCLEACVGSAVRTDVQDAARPLAIGLAQIAHLYAPDSITLGGGVIEHHPSLAARASEAFESLRRSLVPKQTTIHRAPLKSDVAGVRGAALLALGR